MLQKEELEYVPRFTNVRLRNHVLYTPGKAENKLFEICNEVDIDKIQMNLVTGVMKIHLKYWVNNEYQTLVIDRKDLTKTGLVSVLPSRGIQITENSVGILLDYLIYIEKKMTVEYIHDQVGFATIKGEKFFLHYNAHSHSGKINSTYSGKLLIQPKGTLEGELNLIRAEVTGQTPLELSWILGFAAPVTSYLRNAISLDNIIVHSYGRSSSGKSTSSLISVSTYGAPLKSASCGLFGTWMSTPYAIIGRLADNHGLPMVFDEASVMDSKGYAKILYQMAAGQERTRLSSDSTLKDKKNFDTLIISNAENAILTSDNMNQGLRVRVLSLKNITFTKSAENSERIIEGLQKNYANSGVVFIKRILDYEETEFLQKFHQCKAIVLKAFKKRDVFSNRAADKLAVIYLTAIIVEDVFKLGINVEGILDMLVSADEDQVEDRDLGFQAYLAIKEQVTVNLNRFVFKDNSIGRQSFSGQSEYSELPRNEIYGRIVTDSTKTPSEVWILRQKLDKMLKESGFTDAEVVLSEWREKGIISGEKGKFTKKRSLYNNGDVVRVVVISLKGNKYEEIDKGGDNTVKAIQDIKGIYVREDVPEVIEEDIV